MHPMMLHQLMKDAVRRPHMRSIRSVGVWGCSATISSPQIHKSHIFEVHILHIIIYAGWEIGVRSITKTLVHRHCYLCVGSIVHSFPITYVLTIDMNRMSLRTRLQTWGLIFDENERPMLLRTWVWWSCSTNFVSNFLWTQSIFHVLVHLIVPLCYTLKNATWGPKIGFCLPSLARTWVIDSVGLESI